MLNIWVCIRVLKITIGYLLIADIIEMAQPAHMVNLPRFPLLDINYTYLTLAVL